VQITHPVTDLKAVQSIESIELKDESGKHVGQYFFGKGHGRIIFLFGNIEARSRLTLSVRRFRRWRPCRDQSHSLIDNAILHAKRSES